MKCQFLSFVNFAIWSLTKYYCKKRKKNQKNYICIKSLRSLFLFSLLRIKKADIIPIS